MISLLYLRDEDKYLPPLITLCGVDGVGKTTQVKLLTEYFTSKGVKVKFVWVRNPHAIAFIVWKIFSKFGFKRPPLKRTLDKKIWIILEFTSILFKVIIGTYLPLVLGYKLIGERHIVDSIVSIAHYFLRDPSFINGKMARILLNLIPKNSLIIYLDADEKEVAERRIRRKSTWDRHLLHCSRKRFFLILHGIKMQRILYRSLIRVINDSKVFTNKGIHAYTINTTSKNIREAFNCVLDCIERYIEERA